MSKSINVVITTSKEFKDTVIKPLKEKGFNISGLTRELLKNKLKEEFKK